MCVLFATTVDMAHGKLKDEAIVVHRAECCRAGKKESAFYNSWKKAYADRF